MENVWKVIDEENGQFFASCDKEFLGKIKENSDYTKLADHYKLDLRVIPLHFIQEWMKNIILFIKIISLIKK